MRYVINDATAQDLYVWDGDAPIKGGIANRVTITCGEGKRITIVADLAEPDVVMAQASPEMQEVWREAMRAAETQKAAGTIEHPNFSDAWEVINGR